MQELYTLKKDKTSFCIPELRVQYHFEGPNYCVRHIKPLNYQKLQINNVIKKRI